MARCPPVPPVSAAMKARREQLLRFINSDDWRLVRAGLQAQRKRTMEAVAMGSALTDQEIREHQARYRVLTEILEHPVAFLARTDEGDD